MDTGESRTIIRLTRSVGLRQLTCSGCFPFSHSPVRHSASTAHCLALGRGDTHRGSFCFLALLAVPGGDLSFRYWLTPHVFCQLLSRLVARTQDLSPATQRSDDCRIGFHHVFAWWKGLGSFEPLSSHCPRARAC